MFSACRALLLRVGRWPRLLAAAACLLLALLSALGAAQRRAGNARPHTVAVALARHPVASGALLRASDVVVERWPQSLHPPATAPRAADIAGRRAAGAIGVREPLTPARLVGRGLTSGLAPGLGAVPVPSAGDQVSTLVHPGDHVDVLAPPPLDPAGSAPARTEVDVVADDAPVLAVLPGTAGVAGTVVIAADRSIAIRVARAGSTGPFTVVVISP